MRGSSIKHATAQNTIAVLLKTNYYENEREKTHMLCQTVTGLKHNMKQNKALQNNIMKHGMHQLKAHYDVTQQPLTV